MKPLLIACLLTPLATFLVILLFGQREKGIAIISRLGSFAMGLAILGLLGQWAHLGFPKVELNWFTLYRQEEYHFSLVFFFDQIGAAYLACTWLIFAVIVKYCRYYLHREPGYKRFFLTIFAFIFGLNLVILSGELDMLFAGWEVVGIASFLLIAFYRHRLQPIRNALRAYSIYRICDIGLLLATLLIDLMLPESRHFSHLSQGLDATTLPVGDPALFGLSLLLILACMGKSAQFPFCFWIPRAMEGPTPSSAIFYGALSVHLGVFLLLRTEAIWGFEILSRLIVFSIGVITAIVASTAEQTQSNVKGRIAYASITQVGFMFMELALGFGSFVLLHMVGNAFTRCYQLLISPSIVTHLLRVEGEMDAVLDLQQLGLAQSLPRTVRGTLPLTFRNTIQVLSLQEFNLELWVRHLLWDSFKILGTRLSKTKKNTLIVMTVLASVTGLLIHSYSQYLSTYLAVLAILLMSTLSLLGFAHNRYPGTTWNYLASSNVTAGIAAALIAGTHWWYVMPFLGSLIPFWLIGRITIQWMERSNDFLDMPFMYRAMDERQPLAALVLFLCFLGMVGFPLWPSFIGQDLVIYHLSSEHPWMAPLVVLSLVLNGISAAGTYMRMCAGRPVEVRTQEQNP